MASAAADLLYLSQNFMSYPIRSCEESCFGSVWSGALKTVGPHDQVAVAAPRQSGVEALALLQVSLLVVFATPTTEKTS
jgi:hypothetical protein